MSITLDTFHRAFDWLPSSSFEHIRRLW